MENELFEDVIVKISKPYNMPLKTIFNNQNFDVRIYDRNGEMPFIITRHTKIEDKPNQ